MGPMMGVSISRSVASSNILIHDLIKLLLLTFGVFWAFAQFKETGTNFYANFKAASDIIIMRSREFRKKLKVLQELLYSASFSDRNRNKN